MAGEAIALSGAVPDADWQISGWTGTSNNASTASTNSLSMPASAHAAAVNYTLISPVESFAFIVTTDWHTSDSNPNIDIAAKVEKIANWVNNPTTEMPAPEFMVITGDFPNLSQTEGIIDDKLGSDFLWYPVIGNHEISDNINNFNTIRDTTVPSLPNIVNYGPTGSVNTNYSWDYGNSHFIAINPFWDGASNDHTSGGDIPAALNSWIGSDLAANGESHNFVFIHTPAYPAHRHVGEDLDANPANRDAFVATLNTYDVESIFAGHTHYYEHDVAPEYPLGSVHQITNGSLRNGGVPVTFTYVLVEGSKTTYKVYSWNGSDFTLFDEWTIVDCYALTVNHTGVGSDPTATPANSTGCPAGEYVAGEAITLSGAVPTLGWQIGSWTGTSNDSSTANTNSLTMPYMDHTATVNYTQIEYTLAVNVVGNGTVDKSPNQATYYYNDVVQLMANPATDYIFSGWSGDLNGSTNPGTLVIDGNMSVTATFTQLPPTLVCESFNAFTPGSTIGTYTGWYDGGAGPVVTAGNGVAGSTGLAAAANVFNWIAHPFNWNAADFQKFVVQNDFKSDGSGEFDDDRIGWTINSSSVSSSDQFGVQLDDPDGGIVTYWRNSSGTRIQDQIVALSGITANTWYRFKAEITKLTATSASIDVSLVELDASGNPTGTPISGTVADTSTWSGGSPANSYFTPTSMWPTYKTFSSAAAAPADNTCYQVVTGGGPTQYTLTTTPGTGGSITRDPDQATYDAGTVVTLTAVPNSGYSFTSWGDDLGGSTSPTTITMDGNKSVTATFTLIPPTCYALTLGHTGQGSDPVASPANSTGCANGQYVSGEAIALSGAIPASGWQIDSWSGTSNDPSTSSTNSLTMPASAHSALY